MDAMTYNYFPWQLNMSPVEIILNCLLCTWMGMTGISNSRPAVDNVSAHLLMTLIWPNTHLSHFPFSLLLIREFSDVLRIHNWIV